MCVIGNGFSKIASQKCVHKAGGWLITQLSGMFRFGVIADIQYANIADGASFAGTPRYYRHSLEAAEMAVRDWEEKQLICFIAQLGDIIDGFNKRTNIQDESLRAVMSVLQRPGKALHHCIGNHEAFLRLMPLLCGTVPAQYRLCTDELGLHRQGLDVSRR
jgi:hypothetical protein